MTDTTHLTTEQLHAGLDEIRLSPSDNGTIELMLRRPSEGQREILEEATLDTALGVVGDNWHVRPSKRTPDNTPHPEMQVNIMNARAVALLAGDRDRWQLAGDQFYIDMDLGYDNLPPGTRLAFGTAILEVTPQPHTGCDKFVARFGRDAMIFVNSPVGREHNLRGINAKVVRSGVVRMGDVVRKIDGEN